MEWKVSLKILNSGIILKTFTHVVLFTTKIKSDVAKNCVSAAFAGFPAFLVFPSFPTFS